MRLALWSLAWDVTGLMCRPTGKAYLRVPLAILRQSIPLRFSPHFVNFQDVSYSMHFRLNPISGDPRRFLKRLPAERVTANFGWRIQHFLVGEALDPQVTQMAILGSSTKLRTFSSFDSERHLSFRYKLASGSLPTRGLHQRWLHR
jgi:hypothetical protein